MKTKLHHLLAALALLAGLVSASAQTGNTTNGFQALNNNSGSDNTADGYQALFSNTYGNENTAVGYQALFSNTNVTPYSGSLNIAVGGLALYGNTDGTENTALGWGSLSSVTSGGANIGIGYLAGAALTGGNNNIDIFDQGVAGESDTIRIGTKGTQTDTYIAGIYGQTAASGVEVYINPDGHLGTATSSARFKKEIKSMGDASKVLLALKPVTFRYKSELDPQGIPQFGLVAEEVDKIDPDLVARDDKNQIYTVRYGAVNAMLLNEFIKEHGKVEEQGAEIGALKEKAAKVEALESRLKGLEQMVQSLAEKD